MEKKKKKSIHYYMRVLHRDVGFFLIGLTVIFCLSGIILVYRDTDFLKSESTVQRKISPGLELTEVGMVLHIRGRLEVLKEEGTTVYFQNGTYNRETGEVTYTLKELPRWISKMVSLHLVSSTSVVHWLVTLFGVLLLFLAISSFWMYKVKSKYFIRGLILAGAGLVVSLIVLFIH